MLRSTCRSSRKTHCRWPESCTGVRGVCVWPASPPLAAAGQRPSMEKKTRVESVVFVCSAGSSSRSGVCRHAPAARGHGADVFARGRSRRSRSVWDRCGSDAVHRQPGGRIMGWPRLPGCDHVAGLRRRRRWHPDPAGHAERAGMEFDPDRRLERPARRHRQHVRGQSIRPMAELSQATGGPSAGSRDRRNRFVEPTRHLRLRGGRRQPGDRLSAGNQRKRCRHDVRDRLLDRGSGPGQFGCCLHPSRRPRYRRP